MKTLLPLLLLTVALGSCQQETPAPGQDLTALHTQFHGKYQLLAATTDTPVDLDRDGRATTDLSREIPNLHNSDLVLLVQPEGRYAPMFEQAWPQPNVVRDWNHASPDSLTVLGYANQLVPHTFAYDAQRGQLLVTRRTDAVAEDGRFPVPDAVTVTGTGQLEVVAHRQLYTRSGWRTFRVVVRYQRYTQTT